MNYVVFGSGGSLFWASVSFWVGVCCLGARFCGGSGRVGAFFCFLSLDGVVFRSDDVTPLPPCRICLLIL